MHPKNLSKLQSYSAKRFNTRENKIETCWFHSALLHHAELLKTQTTELGWLRYDDLKEKLKSPALWAITCQFITDSIIKVRVYCTLCCGFWLSLIWHAYYLRYVCQIHLRIWVRHKYILTRSKSWHSFPLMDPTDF